MVTMCISGTSPNVFALLLQFAFTEVTYTLILFYLGLYGLQKLLNFKFFEKVLNFELIFDVFGKNFVILRVSR